MKRRSALDPRTVGRDDQVVITKVVVPLDGSPLAARALGPARSLAEATGASLALMTTRWDNEVAEGREPDTVVCMATHGRTGLARVALGSVAMRMLHHSPCPVLVLRPTDLTT